MPFSSFRKEGLQEFPLGVAEKFHIGASLSAAEHGTKGDYQDVVQRKAAGRMVWSDGARVIQGTEQVGELGDGGVTSASTSIHVTPCGVCYYHTEHRNFHMR